MTRRQALLLTGTTLAAQQLTPVEELVNTYEMEAMARRVLSPTLFAEIADKSRQAFDRITLRPRLMVNTTGLDLSIDLFGKRHFAPILIAPMANQGRFHPDGEKATFAGADEAKTAVILPAKSSLTSPWVQIDPANPAIPPTAAVLVVTAPFDWTAIAQLKKTTKLPVVLKGIMSPADAKLAIDKGAAGIVISNYREKTAPGLAEPIEVLPAIATEVANRVPILIDGGFRRGSDILKALALGAKAVCIGRPALWGLSAYGAKGVRQVCEQLQTELARDMAMCGIVKCSAATPAHVRIHRR